MLRDVRMGFLKPRLLGFNYKTASNVVTMNAGVGSAVISSSAAGTASHTFTRSFARRGLFVATAGSDVANAAYVGGTNNTFPTALGFSPIARNASASNTDGTVHCLHLGFDSLETLRFKQDANVVRSEFDQGVLQAFRYNSTTPTILNGARQFSIVKSGTGDVTLTFKNAPSGSKNCVVCAIPVSASALVCNISTVSGLSVRILTFSTAGSATDAQVNVLVYQDAQGPSEKVSCTPLMSSQRKPILFGYSVLYASGAPTLESVLGSTDVTIANTATGRVTFTFAQGFQRAPVMIATAINNTATRYCTIDNVSNTAFEVKNWSSAPALANPTDGSGFQVIGIGFNDATEY